jgi:hypothetical protein
MNTQKKPGKEYRIYWASVAALVPGQTKIQCSNRWNDVLYHRIDRAPDGTCTWTAEDDSKPKNAEQISLSLE